MAVARLLPVSMRPRGLQPGIQCRSVVIFEGPQDIGKSKPLRRRGEAWCREVSGTLEGKEAHMLMKGAWVVELAEMDVCCARKNRVKSFITMCNDANRVKTPLRNWGDKSTVGHRRKPL